MHDWEGAAKQERLSKMVILMIQRDYAYGRDGTVSICRIINSCITLVMTRALMR